MIPSLATDPYGVTLLGEALGADEAKAGRAFVGKAGFKLTRLIEWAGLDRSKFDIFNTAWCRPPNNRLEGTVHEDTAISHCRGAHWGALLDRSRVVVPLGNVATSALLKRKGILSIRGYVWAGDGYHIIPSVHPSFIQRGQAKWSAALIHDLQKSVQLATEGLPTHLTSYMLDPSPSGAYQWARSYLLFLEANPNAYLAFDIETPFKKADEDEIVLDSDAPDRTWKIDRIAFSFRGLYALSIPWGPEYRAAIALILGSAGPKVVWNQGFDVPRVRREGVVVNGIIHDGMVAWHILHTDLPKSLRFVATFTCPWQPAWKHLSSARPAFYNATDADVELRSMVAIEKELRRTGLWDVYQRDVVDLEPILVHMHQKGMPVDASIRLDRATKLNELLIDVKKKMEECIPLIARRIAHVYKRDPARRDGLLQRPGHRSESYCPNCDLSRPRRSHFKRFVKRSNPCADYEPRERDVSVIEYYRLHPFTPSRDQLIRYHKSRNRALPTVWDAKDRRKRTSFGEKQLKELVIRYADDPLYSLVLKHRSLDKTAGTYIGRIDDGD